MGGSALPVRVYHSGRDHHPVAHQWHTNISITASKFIRPRTNTHYLILFFFFLTLGHRKVVLHWWLVSQFPPSSVMGVIFLVYE